MTRSFSLLPGGCGEAGGVGDAAPLDGPGATLVCVNGVCLLVGGDPPCARGDACADGAGPRCDAWALASPARGCARGWSRARGAGAPRAGAAAVPLAGSDVVLLVGGYASASRVPNGAPAALRINDAGDAEWVSPPAAVRGDDAGGDDGWALAGRAPAPRCGASACVSPASGRAFLVGGVGVSGGGGCDVACLEIVPALQRPPRLRWLPLPPPPSGDPGKTAPSRPCDRRGAGT